MTKKHFEIVADTLATVAKDTNIEDMETLLAFAREFSARAKLVNPRFNVEKFFTAAFGGKQ